MYTVELSSIQKHKLSKLSEIEMKILLGGLLRAIFQRLFIQQPAKKVASWKQSFRVGNFHWNAACCNFPNQSDKFNFHQSALLQQQKLINNWFDNYGGQSEGKKRIQVKQRTALNEGWNDSFKLLLVFYLSSAPVYIPGALLNYIIFTFPLSPFN